MLKATLEKRVSKLEETTPEHDLSHVSRDELHRHIFLNTKSIFGELTSEEADELAKSYEKVWRHKTIAEKVHEKGQTLEKCDPELFAKHQDLAVRRARLLAQMCVGECCEHLSTASDDELKFYEGFYEKWLQAEAEQGQKVHGSGII